MIKCKEVFCETFHFCCELFKYACKRFICLLHGPISKFQYDGTQCNRAPSTSFKCESNCCGWLIDFNRVLEGMQLDIEYWLEVNNLIREA